MTEPNWIEKVEVIALHFGVIELGGGAQGLRDASLLESALARAQNQFAFGESDLFMLAATYAEGIARNHPFVDGNKRTAFATAMNFLDLNGVLIAAAPATEHAEMMETLAQGNLTREQAADHFRIHVL